MDSTVSKTSLDLDALTEDEFLGGQLRLLQPRHGYRAGMDAAKTATPDAERVPGANERPRG